jgi:YidC/Oxa1 family membrane protein insertase
MVPAPTPPFPFVSGRIRSEAICRGGSLGKSWLAGVPAHPGSDATTEAGALEFLNEVEPGKPGAFSVTLSSPELELVDLEAEPWTLVSRSPLTWSARALKWERDGKGIIVVKRLLPVDDGEAWHFRMEVEVRNEDPELAGAKLDLRVRGASLVHSPEGSRDLIAGRVKLRNTSSPKSTTGPAALSGIQKHEPILVDGDVEWAATCSTYFAAILDPDDAGEGEAPHIPSVRWEGLVPPATERDPHPFAMPSPVLSIPLGVKKEGVATTVGFTCFVGPTANDIPIAGEYHPVLDRPEYERFKPVRDPGWFDLIGQGMFFVLRAFHAVIPNWGVAIILLTVLVRGCLFPLSRKQLRSTIEYSKKMQKIKPKIDALKDKHGDDRRKISEEQFKLMKEHDVPLMPGGCLLTFLQLPIWISLYGMLQHSYELRHAGFLWVQDLSQADHLWHMLPGVNGIPMVPNAAEWLNLLPLLMTATWFFSSKATMTPPADEQQAQMQKMMQWMPFIMLLFPGFYTMPAGLCLYITVSSSWGIVESRLIRKSLGTS